MTVSAPKKAKIIADFINCTTLPSCLEPSSCHQCYSHLFSHQSWHSHHSNTGFAVWTNITCVWWSSCQQPAVICIIHLYIEIIPGWHHLCYCHHSLAMLFGWLFGFGSSFHFIAYVFMIVIIWHWCLKKDVSSSYRHLCWGFPLAPPPAGGLPST